jgi:hypothetical protein
MARPFPSMRGGGALLVLAAGTVMVRLSYLPLDSATG